MDDFILETVALPFRVIEFIARYLFKTRLQRLHRIIWKITDNPSDAFKYFQHLYLSNPKTARAVAEELLSDKNSGKLYTNLCILDYRSTGDPQKAVEWLKMAYADDCKDQHMLLYIELILADEEEEVRKIASKILERNDLPAYFTKLALLNMILYHIKTEQWHNAEVVADRILSIEEDRLARALKLSLSIRFGRGDAEKHRRYLRSKNPDQYNGILAIAYYYAGNNDECRTSFHLCSKKYLQNFRLEKDIEQVVSEVIAEKEHAESA